LSKKLFRECCWFSNFSILCGHCWWKLLVCFKTFIYCEQHCNNAVNYPSTRILREAALWAWCNHGKSPYKCNIDWLISILPTALIRLVSGILSRKWYYEGKFTLERGTILWRISMGTACQPLSEVPVAIFKVNFHSILRHYLIPTVAKWINY
jgi:hypothetical protein